MPSIPAVQADARGTLLSYTEAHITQLIREAVQVQHHCKRARFHLSTDKDAKSTASSSAAATKTKSRVGILRRRLHADDINMALQWRGSEKIYATGIVGGGGVTKSSSRDDKKVVLEDYLKSEIKIRPPQEVGLTLHWLAVDGVQPSIPQNPGGVGTSTSSANALKRKHPLVHRVEDDEDEEDASGGDGVQVTQLLPRLLSEELRLYFSRITGAVERGGATPITRQQQDTALASLTQDPGLQELIPFMINYVTKNLYKHLGNPEHCRTLIRMAQALLANPHIHLELYLHQLLPAILTMVVAHRLSSKSFDNHWILRYEAALCLVQACNLFGEDYATLKARVLKTLSDAIGPNRSLSTRYGGLVAITFFGPKAINAFVLPLALEYWNASESMLLTCTDLEQRMEIHMFEQAILDALGVFLGPTNRDSPEAMDIEWEELEDTFGDRLVMLSTNETEYATCFI
eukprot:CAMPEP_0116127472 /NCGR_PEP_ID=MMETSP0329-20121206/6857_1 /TAXON_ID=697910 /ORGANISM="Pseudo-nitzschia arenysensis, Strain B593" /LENGTH=459 /DNA_ID=CAMNT_0003621571 /DNA_START=81 /DNA_END=1460 /DNA_ORIENTATION=+